MLTETTDLQSLLFLSGVEQCVIKPFSATTWGKWVYPHRFYIKGKASRCKD